MTELRWGPRPAVFVLAGVVFVIAAGWVFIGSRTEDRLVAGAVAVVALAGLLVALRMRDRLRASAAGLVIGTVSGQRSLAWSQIRRVEVVQQKRLGTSSTALEIDFDSVEIRSVDFQGAGQHSSDGLLVFGRMDLGTDPAEVADALSRIRTGLG